MWAHAALRQHGVAVPEADTVQAMTNVLFAIQHATERGRFPDDRNGSPQRRPSGAGGHCVRRGIFCWTTR